jgi:TolB-like protein
LLGALALSFVAELKRRNVLKVGAAYLVVAWLLIQVVATLAPQLQLPDWAPRLITLVLLVGFPIAIVMAWVFERAPDGLKVEPAPFGNKRIYAIAGMLAVAAVGWYLKGQSSLTGDAGGAGDGPVSVAVLPFANLSGDEEQEFFSDGMTEELLNVLAKIPALKVAARTSVFEFKDKGGDVRAIGAKLGVSHIVEGSVRRDGPQVRVTAQLIRVADGFHVWSETYDRELKGVFALQDEIARRIAGQLKGSLAVDAAPAARVGIDPVAYDAYLKGRAMYRARRNLPQVIALLEDAVARAPDFAAAWASLSLAREVAYWTTTPLQRIALGEALPGMRAAAERAAALDPDAAITLHALGNVARGDHRYADAERLYLRAIEAEPTYPDVREDYAELLFGVARDEDSLAASRELVTMEPLVEIFWFRLAELAATLDRQALLDEAVAHMAEAAPDGVNTNLAPVTLALYHGRIDEARAGFAIARKRAPAVTAEDWVMFRWSQGDPAVDDRLARATAEANHLFAYYAALRGDADLFFTCVAAAGNSHIGYNVYSVMRTPIGQPYLADPRAKHLLRDYGFEAYWREKGWPALCKPLGTDDFECGAAAGKAN